MKLYKLKINYFDEQNFGIYICNITISFIDNKYINKIKQEPKLLNKFKQDITIDDVMLTLDQDKFIPSKEMHDRKIRSFIKKSNHKLDENKTYWISNINVIKEIGETKFKD